MAGVAVVLLAWAAGGAGGSAATPSPRPHPHDLSLRGVFAVDAVSSSDAWAVGRGGAKIGPLLEHWDGASWSRADGPAVDGGYLRAVSAAGPDDVWAVGQAGLVAGGRAVPLTEHWDGTSWTRVPITIHGDRVNAEIRALQDRGFATIGFGNPLRDLAGDARYLAEYLSTLSGPIVLVGHSYGGNVISVAASSNEQVKALVYFNGWMCDVGESQQQLLEKFEDSLVGPSIRPVPFTNPDGSEGVDLYLAPEAFHEAFAADVDPETAAIMAATQRPYAAAAFAATPSAPPAWNTLPCRYLLGTEDKAIPPALQRYMAERANATIVEVPASHVSFVSQPDAATQLILQAVEATTSL